MEKAFQEMGQGTNKIMEVLRRNGIIIPIDFADKLIENAQTNYQGKLPPIKAIKAVIRMCDYWKEYCTDNEEFSKLVCKKIYSMVRIHASVITSNSQDDTCYIGRLCKLKENADLPKSLFISTTYGGTIKKQGQFAGTIVEL